MKRLILFPDGPWALLDAGMNTVDCGDDYLTDDAMKKYPDAETGAVISGRPAIELLHDHEAGFVKRRIN